MDKIPVSLMLSILLLILAVIVYMVHKKSLIWYHKKEVNSITIKGKKIKDWILIISFSIGSVICFLHFINS